MRAVNLIPAEQRRGAGGVAGRTGGVVYVIVATLVVIVALGVVYVSAVHQVATRNATLAQVTAQAGAVGSQATALQPYVAFDSVSKQRIQGVAALAEQRFDWPDAMAQLALSLPSGVHLISLSGATAGAGTGGVTGAATGTTGPTQSSSGSTVTVSATDADAVRLRSVPGRRCPDPFAASPAPWRDRCERERLPEGRRVYRCELQHDTQLQRELRDSGWHAQARSPQHGGWLRWARADGSSHRAAWLS